MCGKCFLPNNLSDVFGPPITAEDDEDFEPPDWLLESIKQVAGSSVPPPAEPPFQFVSNEESVQHNTDLLASYGYDLAKIIDDNKDTTLAYGSEFCPIENLTTIYCDHELFPFFT